MGCESRVIWHAEIGKGTLMGQWTNQMQVNAWARQTAAQRKQASQQTNARSNTGYLDFLQQDFQKRETGAREANVKRETEIRGIYDQLIGQGQGAFRTAGLADIERGKTRAVGQGMQQMVSSGLFGTTTAASIPVQAENQASLSRLKLEDIIQQRTTELKLGKAGFVERIEDPYPDYNQLIQAMAAGASR